MYLWELYRCSSGILWQNEIEIESVKKLLTASLKEKIKAEAIGLNLVKGQKSYEITYMIEPYEVYKLYLAIKLHFTTKSYDVVKYKGKVRVKPETFRKRKDMVSIKKLARDYKREEIIDFLVANFVSGERWGGLFDIQASRDTRIGRQKRIRERISLSKGCLKDTTRDGKAKSWRFF